MDDIQVKNRASDWTPAENSKTVMASNSASRGMMRPHHSRSPPFLVIGLAVVVIILGFNYWSLSSRNTDLAKELQEFQDKFRIAALKKMSTDRRNEQLVLKVQELELSAAKLKTEEDIKIQKFSKDLSKRVAELAVMQEQLHKYKNQLIEINKTKQADTLKKEECPKVVCPTPNPHPTPLSVITVECADAMRQYRDRLLAVVDKLYGWRAANVMKKQVPEPPTSRPAGSIDITNKTKNASKFLYNIPQNQQQQVNLAAQQPDQHQNVVLQHQQHGLQPQGGNLAAQGQPMAGQQQQIIGGQQQQLAGQQQQLAGQQQQPAGQQQVGGRQQQQNVGGQQLLAGQQQVAGQQSQIAGGQPQQQQQPGQQLQQPNAAAGKDSPPLGGNMAQHGLNNLDEQGNPKAGLSGNQDEKKGVDSLRTSLTQKNVTKKVDDGEVKPVIPRPDLGAGHDQQDDKKDAQLQVPLPGVENDVLKRNPKPLGLGAKLDDQTKTDFTGPEAKLEKPVKPVLPDQKLVDIAAEERKVDSGADMPKRPVLPESKNEMLTGHRSGPRDSLLKPAGVKDADKLSAEHQKAAVDDLNRGGAAAAGVADGYKALGGAGGDDLIDSPDKPGGADSDKANNAQDKPIDSKDHVDDAFDSPGIVDPKYNKMGKSLDDETIDADAPHEMHANDPDKDENFRPM